MTQRFALALLLPALLLGVPALAAEMAATPVAANEPTVERIKWDAAPPYIQQQAKNVVMHCSEGEYTANQVKIYRHGTQEENSQSNYIMDFSAMRALQTQLPGCNYNSPVCSNDGCFLMVYTEFEKGKWDQSWFGTALSMRVMDIPHKGKKYRGVEVMQSADNCSLANGGKSQCPMHFAWVDNKFKYFGYARLEPADPTAVDEDGNPIPGPVRSALNPSQVTAPPASAKSAAPVEDEEPQQ